VYSGFKNQSKSSEAATGRINQTAAVIGLIFCIRLLFGCTEVVVPGAMTGAGEYYRYTTTNVGKKTLMGDVDQITVAAKRALKRMDIRLHSVESEDDDTKMTASTEELDITINMTPITAATTKVTVNAVEDHVIKDKATSAEILSQIQVELDRSPSPDNASPRVFVKNECNRDINVIVYYLAGKNEPETWQTRGWFNLAPGQKKYAANTHNRYIYFYGEARFEDKLVWTGDILQWFEGRRYGFFKVDMGTKLVDFTQSFNCD
jgi:hypothetical protein